MAAFNASYCGSGARNVGGLGTETAGIPIIALSSELPSDDMEVADCEMSTCNSALGGVTGESASISIRLRGLGLAGEYAWNIRCAKGLATGNGRRGATGVWSLGGE